MAVGDAALAAGMALMTGAEMANDLDREINRTRDYIANRGRRATTPVNEGGTGATAKSGARTNLGITSGTAAPSGGSNGDIYFKIVS